MELTRQDKILKMIVETFIKKAEPVGSHTLIEQYGLSLSSATIRNEMNALEKAGYLEKTHTSSGRVPSSKGYRYYVDKLRDNSVNEELKFQIQSLLSKKVQSVEDVIKESCEILSHMTNLASIVLGPNAQEEHLVSLQVIPINEKTVTAVFVTDQGYVENKTFIIPNEMNMEELVSCVKLINDRIKGTPIAGLVEKVESLKPVISDYIIDSSVLYQALLEAFVRFAGDRLSLYGKDQLYDQPEFAKDAEKLRKVVEMLENPESFKKVQEDQTKEVNVQIGGPSNELSDVAIISAKVQVNTESGDSTIALVGPKRMDYDQVVSAITYVTRELDNYFKERKGESSWKKNKTQKQTKKKSTRKSK